jgi:N-acetylmuramoyl-L-alanine amidase
MSIKIYIVNYCYYYGAGSPPARASLKGMVITMNNFKKCILTAVLAALVLTAATFAQESGDVFAGSTGGVAVYVDGAPVRARTDAAIIKSQTYVSFREYSAALGAGGALSVSGGALRASAPGLTVEARAGDCYIIANGRYLYAPSGCIGAGSDVLVPLRSLAGAFGAEVTWSAGNRAVYIRTGGSVITPGGSYYNSEDLKWLSRIIYAEAGGELMQGKIAVGNVVLNRRDSPMYPNTVYGVIFDKRSGVQFTPAYSGAINRTPSEDCVIAAKIALDGGNTAGGSLFFSSAYSKCWAASHRPLYGQIGNHNFFV